MEGEEGRKEAGGLTGEQGRRKVLSQDARHGCYQCADRCKEILESQKFDGGMWSDNFPHC